VVALIYGLNRPLSDMIGAVAAGHCGGNVRSRHCGHAMNEAKTVSVEAKPGPCYWA
jgi:hypothetical protein